MKRKLPEKALREYSGRSQRRVEAESGTAARGDAGTEGLQRSLSKDLQGP